MDGAEINRNAVRFLTPGPWGANFLLEGIVRLRTKRRSDHGPLSYSSVFAGMSVSRFAAIRWRVPMSYTVYIKQSATGLVRTRVETDEWDADGALWTSGNRACDCARALLFAHTGEKVPHSCGGRAYVIRVISPDGEELYSEDDF